MPTLNKSSGRRPGHLDIRDLDIHSLDFDEESDIIGLLPAGLYIIGGKKVSIRF